MLIHRQKRIVRHQPQLDRLLPSAKGKAERPTALYVANGVMAIGVMRAIADLGLRCPAGISIASTDTIAGMGE